ncbi:hypothetical protein [Streptomyces sp. RB17]|uniref:hypothetical protein n=1 Tax=Streptomyces sp. RB17 TaxID=2585197 RepID=UPI001295ED2E|nr:hypothetical protein [Streptomyces sp. RB17]
MDAKPGGAERFRQNAAKIQDDALHYEKLVGTVHDFRVTFINNDTQVRGAVTDDGDFKPYMADIFANAGPWFDEMFDGVIESYPGAGDLASSLVGAEDRGGRHVVRLQSHHDGQGHRQGTEGHGGVQHVAGCSGRLRRF